jgi:hypothetical protein
LGYSLCLALVAAPAMAGDYHAPKTAFGAPDLEGLWSNSSLTQFERPKDFTTLVIPEAEAQAYDRKNVGQPPPPPEEDKVGQGTSEWWETQIGLARIRGFPRTSWIVSPADGQTPYSDEAKARHKVRGLQLRTDFDNPETRALSERCLPDGAGPPLMNGGYNDNFQFVQTRDQLAIVGEYGHEVRIVRIDGSRHPPASVRRWQGDSIGHWEGDTLVIETTNFTAAEVDAPLDPKADMRVVERIRRLSATELSYEFTLDEPAVLIQPVRGEIAFHTTKGPLYEFACHEGNYAMANILAGGRQQDGAAGK